ncbi:MAG: hypothetical protein DMG07_17040 [Acidobacteria bacterium]|nr:MAG: hypothetical protein DMG07_17040 [Acidobacteriota bacterium]
MGAVVWARNRAERLSAPAVFDVHLHIPSENGGVFQGLYGPTRTMEDFVRYLDRCGVARGIISSAQSVWATSPEEFRAGNREVARWAEKYGHRFAGACVVHPVYIEEALREIEECHRQFDMVWVGEIINYHRPYGWSYSIRQMQQVLEQVSRLKMALHIHTSEPQEIRALAEAPGFEATPVVWAHLKDGTFYEEVDVLRRYPNTYLDVAAGVNLAMGSIEYAVKHLGSRRVLFSSTPTSLPRRSRTSSAATPTSSSHGSARLSRRRSLSPRDQHDARNVSLNSAASTSSV